jgi:hypothetical protein
MADTLPFSGPIKERAKEGLDRLLLAPVFLIYEIVAVLFPGLLFVILLFVKGKVTGWTHCTRGSYCPFCGKEKTFRVNFTEAKFQCFGCERNGRLGKLVQKLLGTASMTKVKAFVREQMNAKAA